MKKYIRTFILLISLLMVSNVYAADTLYTIKIDENNHLDVYDYSISYQTPLSSYPDILSYENNVLTLKKGYMFNNIYSRQDITITTNNELVSLDYINGGYEWAGRLTFRNARLNSLTYYPEKSIEIYDSSLNIKAIDAEDDIQGATNNIYIENSKILVENGIYTEGEIASITVKNSEIVGTGSNSYLEVLFAPIKSTGLWIDNSTIDLYRIGSTIRNDATEWGKTKITNSTVNLKSYMHTSTDIEIDNSTVNAEYLRCTYSRERDRIDIKDSEVNVKTFTETSGTTNIENSKVMLGTKLTTSELLLKNSYLSVINDNEEYVNSWGRILTAKTLDIDNSYFYIESKTDTELAKLLPGYSIRLNDGLKIYDKDMTELTTKDYTEDNNTYGTFYYSNNTKSKSALISSKATVTFRIKNGTWADGTTNDIVITKTVWDKLTDEDIPKGMKGNTNGSWEIEPNTTDYIKGDIVYNYVFKEVKGIDTNPSTGVITTTIIIVSILAIIGIFYMNLYKKSYFN